MKDLKHYFGQSPKGDESPSSAKENDLTSEVKSVENCMKEGKSAKVLKQNLSNRNCQNPSVDDDAYAVSKTPKSSKSKHSKSNSKKGLKTRGKLNVKDNEDDLSNKSHDISKNIQECNESMDHLQNSVTNGCFKSKPLKNAKINTTVKTCNEQSPPIITESFSSISNGDNDVCGSEQQQFTQSITQFFSPKRKSCHEGSVTTSEEIQSVNLEGTSANSKSCLEKPKEIACNDKVKKGAKRKVESTIKKAQLKSRLSITKRLEETAPSEPTLDQEKNITTKQTQVSPSPSAMSRKYKSPRGRTVKSATKKLTLSKGKCAVTQNGESELSTGVGIAENEKADGSSSLHDQVKKTMKCIMSKDVKSESSQAVNGINLEKSSVSSPKADKLSQKSDSNPIAGKQCSDLFINLKKSGKTKRNLLQLDSDHASITLVDPKNPVQNERGEKPLDQVLMGDAEPNEVLSPKTDDSRCNSLMKYFPKVTKEEALAKTEKVELRVEVMVHSPPTTPSKKERRRYMNSSRKSLSTDVKKSKLVKNKPKANIDAIHVIGVEEINPSDVKLVSHIDKVEVLSHQEMQSETGAEKPLLKKSLKKTKSAPGKSCPVESLNVPDTNLLFKESQREISTSKKKIHPFTSKKIEKKSKNVGLEEKGSPSKCAKGVEMSPEVLPEKTEERKTNQEWKLRVCLTPHGLPSTRGTMQEEDSDCEEIFLTPNTKKRRIGKDMVTKMENSNSVKGRRISEQADNETDCPDIIVELEKPLLQSKTGKKLAPLFVLKEKVKARQEFLLSGVPDQVKKMVEAHQMFEDTDVELFPLISHIQQQTEENVWRLPNVELPLKPDLLEESFELSSALCNPGLISECFGESEELNKILSVSCEGPRPHVRKGFSTSLIKPILRLIRKESPDFKVVNTFTTLREKVRQERQAAAAAERATATAALTAARKARRRSSSAKQSQSVKETDAVHPAFRSQVWTEKYKPLSASEIIGNEDCVLQLKRWLEAWRKVSEEARKQCRKEETSKVRQRRKRDEYDDDFIVSDNSSDSGTGNLPMNPALLYGKSGSGKTCSVYALANDYGFKVLEVNASEKRNGKVILSKLSEATQSHQVQRSNSAEQGFAALFGVKASQPSAPKNKKPKLEIIEISEDKEDEKAEKMSLILIDDVDIVFEEEDEGFISALLNLISTSKRPVILTTTDPESQHIARFFNSSSLILYFSPSQENLCTWLQLVCLLEGVYAAPTAVKALVALCDGDIRRALLQMQVWVTTGGNNLPIPPLPVVLPASRKRKKGGDQCEIDVVDDLSCISLDEHVSSSACHDDAVPLIPPNPDCIGALLGRNDKTNPSEDRTSHLIPSYPLNTGLLWWNLAPMLGLPQISHQPLPVVKEYPQSSGTGKLLNDSFFTTFCSDEENSNEPISNKNCTRGDSEDSLKLHVEEIASGKPDQTEEKCPSYRSSCTQEEMTALMRQMGSLSAIDIISTFTHLPETIDCDEPVSRTWQKPAKNSLLLSKPVVMGPNYTLESTARGLIHWLGEQTLSETRHCLKSVCYGKEAEPFFDSFDPCLPSFDERRWRLVHADCEQAIIAAIPLCVQLDRRAVAADYMSAIQTVSWLERNRSIANTKRRNRFYHYLKGMGLHLTDMQLEFFCQSMSRLS